MTATAQRRAPSGGRSGGLLDRLAGVEKRLGDVRQGGLLLRVAALEKSTQGQSAPPGKEGLLTRISRLERHAQPAAPSPPVVQAPEEGAQEGRRRSLVPSEDTIEAASWSKEPSEASDMPEAGAEIGRTLTEVGDDLGIDAPHPDVLGRQGGETLQAGGTLPLPVTIGRVSDPSPPSSPEKAPPAAAPEPETSAEAVARLTGVLGDAPRVCVLGSTSFSNPDSEALTAEIANQLTPRLAGRVCVITGGNPGVQQVFAKNACEATRLYSLLPFGQASGYGIGEDIFAGEDPKARAAVMGLLGDVYLSIEGGPGVSGEARAAAARGAAVVPLQRSGGASSGMFDFPATALEAPEGIDKERWELLASSDVPVAYSASAAADAVVHLLRARGHLPEASDAPVVEASDAPAEASDPPAEASARDEPAEAKAAIEKPAKPAPASDQGSPQKAPAAEQGSPQKGKRNRRKR